MFNQNALIFGDLSGLEAIRKVPSTSLLILLGVFYLAYVLRVFSLILFYKRIGSKGGWVSVFSPFLGIGRLGQSRVGFGTYRQVFNAFIILVGIASVFGLLVAPSFDVFVLSISGLITMFIYKYMVLIRLSRLLKKDRVSYLWGIPIIGSIAMIASTIKSRKGSIFHYVYEVKVDKSAYREESVDFL